MPGLGARCSFPRDLWPVPEPLGASDRASVGMVPGRQSSDAGSLPAMAEVPGSYREAGEEAGWVRQRWMSTSDWGRGRGQGSQWLLSIPVEAGSSVATIGNFFLFLEEGQMALVAWSPRSSLAARCFPMQARSQPTALAGLPWQMEEQHSLETAVFLPPPGCIAS